MCHARNRLFCKRLWLNGGRIWYPFVHRGESNTQSLGTTAKLFHDTTYNCDKVLTIYLEVISKMTKSIMLRLKQCSKWIKLKHGLWISQTDKENQIRFARKEAESILKKDDVQKRWNWEKTKGLLFSRNQMLVKEDKERKMFIKYIVEIYARGGI